MFLIAGALIVVGLGVALSGWALLGRRPQGSEHVA
jgi:hypothetical protein